MILRSNSAVFGIALAWLVAATPITSAAAEPQSLGRTFEKLKKEKKLTIAYFGGSITAGAGAFDASKTSWRALTTDWFKKNCPEAKISEVNAAIGGTGSDLGAFRCAAHVTSKDPDLVFVEFAVNDDGKAELRVKRSVEGIVRHIWLSNPWAEIVLVYTTTKALAPAYAKGEVPKAVSYHQVIAKHYGIPEVNVGRDLVEQIGRGEGTWESLTTDGVHPSDAGYAVYMKSIANFLESHRNDTVAPPLIDLGDSLTQDPLSGAFLQDAAMLSTPGWQKEDQSLGGHYPHYISTDVPETELVHKFTGTTVGVFWLIAPDSGDIEWSIDDGKPTRLSSWDKYALKFSRAGYFILADDLPSGEHTLKIKVLGESNSQSTGTWIRIGAILIHCPC